MAEPSPTGGGVSYKPYVPANTKMTEFSAQALILGLLMAVILGAANAYLGLKAGMTIAATYPAAVISMALLRILKGSILEENLARTVGSIGESVAAGAIFTVPAFIIAGVWTELRYFEATAIMAVGGIIGVLFVTMLRRVMVEDKELPYPESVAASEIHKVGRSGGTGAKFLLIAGLVGAGVQTLKQRSFFASSWEKFIPFAHSSVSLGGSGKVAGGGGMLLSTPGVSPAYIGVGYIIGPRLASLNFSGGLLAWGLFVPLLLYFIGPQLETAGGEVDWTGSAIAVWKSIVRPIAIGGMLVSAAYTLYRMRQSLLGGIKRSIADVRKAATAEAPTDRIESDMSFKWVMIGLLLSSVLTFLLYYYFADDLVAAVTATIVMVVAGFFFAAVSGYLVGLIGSSNNPISGLTLSTVIVAALLMVALGQTGPTGIAAVLGVAGVICVSAAVAGEMLQDLKVGHILGGTPSKMQAGDMLGVVAAAAVMFIPLLVLHTADVNSGGLGFGGKALPAPQAGLMALLAQGIVGGGMAWPLIIVGMVMAIGMICLQVKSPMLVSVGMYLPLETTFAIFVGGIFRWLTDVAIGRSGFNKSQTIRSTNTGMLLASGFIAGEALMGLCIAALAFFELRLPGVFEKPSYLVSLAVFAVIALVLIRIPLSNAGNPDDPPPPEAVM